MKHPTPADNAYEQGSEDARQLVDSLTYEQIVSYHVGDGDTSADLQHPAENRSLARYDGDQEMADAYDAAHWNALTDELHFRYREGV